MSDFKFKPSDFNFPVPMSNEDFADVANTKLSEWLSRGVKVHGARHNDMWCMSEIIVDGAHLESQTHEAILVNIKPIERECKHKNITLVGTQGLPKFSRCDDCFKKLKATWSVCE